MNTRCSPRSLRWRWAARTCSTTPSTPSCPAGTGWPAAAPGLDLPYLAGEAWVGGRAGGAWFRIVRHACRTAGFDPRVALSSDDYRAVQAFVAAGLGVAVIPGLAVARAARRAPDDSFQPPAVRTMITILETITRRLRTPAA